MVKRREELAVDWVDIEKDTHLRADDRKKISHVFGGMRRVNTHFNHKDIIFLPVDKQFDRGKEGDFKPGAKRVAGDG